MDLHVNSDFWHFVNTNITSDPSVLRLKYHSKDTGDLDVNLAITQIECRKKFSKKFSQTLSHDPLFLFPSVLAGEQATSDLLSTFHASLIRENTRLLDLTAGLGIDSLHFAQKAANVRSIEIDENKAAALSYNASHLNAANLEVVFGDCKEKIDRHWDYMFIDPHRRGEQGKRVFALSDCQPDVISLLPKIRLHSDTLIVKASPMLDITRMAAELPGCTQIIALGTPTECKELIAIVDCKSSQIGLYSIRAVTLSSDKENMIEFTPLQEREAQANFIIPREGWFLYEPYPSVMKAAPFSLISQKYGVGKLHANTHLYVSEDLVANFPGEAFEIWAIYPFMSKHIKRLKLDYPQINVATRNFDMAAEKLRAKLGVKDGGDMRLFAVTAGPRELMIVVKKV